MARYLYACEDDHEQIEKHGMTESPTITCEKCGKVMRKKLTAQSTGFSCQYWDGNTKEYYGDGRH